MVALSRRSVVLAGETVNRRQEAAKLASASQRCVISTCLVLDSEEGGRRGGLAEKVGFEPTVDLRLRRFSRPLP